MANEIAHKTPQQGEIILYQPDETVRIEVRLEDDTVWLTQAQMAELFQKDQSVIARHIGNVFREGELNESSNMQILHNTLSKYKPTKVYNLNVIISVGYRVKSKRGTQFRIWATSILREFLLRGYAVSQQTRFLKEDIDNRLLKHEKRIEAIEEKIDFFVRTNQPPVEGIFFDGQIFDAYRFVSDLIRKARRRIVLIDNYVDDTVLTMLDKRTDGVCATIYTQHISQQFQQDIDRHNAQYPPIIVEHFNRAHDRFLLIDDEVYHIGASLKDLGRKWFAFTLMHDLTAAELISRIGVTATVNIQK